MKSMLVAAMVCVMAAAQTTSKENQVRDRGQTPIKEPPVTVRTHRNRDWNGMLVDAGCTNRTTLQGPPVASSAPPKSGDARAGGVSAKGVHVDPRTLKAERGDVMEHRVPDLASRQGDPGCAITGATRGFALLLPDGRLLNLDEGGNTKALEAFESSSAGQEVLSGRSPGFKPKARLQGRLRGDRLMVESIRLSR